MRRAHGKLSRPWALRLYRSNPPRVAFYDNVDGPLVARIEQDQSDLLGCRCSKVSVAAIPPCDQ